MKKSLFIFTLICFFATSISLAETNQDKFTSEDEFSKWFTYYYISPQPQRLYSALTFFCSSTLYKDKVILPMMSFFVAALKNNDTELDEIYAELNRNSTIQEKTFFLDVLWLINTDESKNIIERAASEWTDEAVQEKVSRQHKSIPYNVPTIPIVSPQILDMLWATFFATGDEEIVQRIISVIHLSKDGKGTDVLIGAAASWSLKSNAKQHKKVMDICKQELGKQTGLTKNLLQEIVAE